MRKIPAKRFTLLLSVLNVFLFSPAIGQWMPFSILSPYPTSNTIHAAAALGANHLIGVTSRGEAVMTTDGGSTWRVDTISQGIYRCVSFVNDRVGWAAGAGNKRLHRTTDSGFRWIQIGDAPDTTVYGIDFVDARHGWAVGYNGFIIKTENGGDNWFSQSITATSKATLYGVDALDERSVFVAGNEDLLIKSTNGGTTWAPLPPIFSNPTDYRTVVFSDSSTGFVAGFGSRIARTTDGGKTWRRVHDPGGNRTLWSIAFNSTNVCLAVGSSSEVLRSTDGGVSWKRLLLPGVTTLTFYTVAFGSDTMVYIVGSNGARYKSTDAGATWQ